MATKKVEPFMLSIGQFEIELDPTLLRHSGIKACTGCVVIIDYDDKGVAKSVIIRWLDGCAGEGRATTFNVNAGLARVFERAQDNCLRVTVFFLNGREPRIIKVLTRPDDGSCCPCDCDENGDNNGERRWF
jgi:hypothetical protein